MKFKICYSVILTDESRLIALIIKIEIKSDTT